MKLFNNKAIAALASIALFAMSCKKVDTPDPIGDAGQTVVKIIGGGDAPNYGYKLLGVSFVNSPQTVSAVQIYRDAPSSAALNTSLTVVVKDDTAALRAYNTANGTNILPLPRTWYTASPAPTSIGGTYTVTFAPGESSKYINLLIPNSTLLDPSASYGIAFTVVSNDGNAINSSGKSYIFAIGAKNAYDGIYTVVSGYVQRYTGPGAPESGANTVGNLNGDLAGNADVVMTTTAANTVEWANHNWAFLGASAGIAGINNLRATVDPATNLVTMMALGNATLHNWTGFTAGPWNVYDPATKTFRVAMTWVSTAPAYREYQIVLKYKGPR
jgi:hypothetical protein